MLVTHSFFMLFLFYLSLISFLLNPKHQIRTRIFLVEGFPGCSEGKESACRAGDLASVTGSGGSPGEGQGYLPIREVKEVIATPCNGKSCVFNDISSNQWFH